jgi:hypothetical protein
MYQVVIFLFLPATDEIGTQFTKNDRIDPNRICLLNKLLDFLMATQIGEYEETSRKMRIMPTSQGQ